MRIMILCVVFIIGYLGISFLNTLRVTIPYHYEGPYPYLVREALNQWSVVDIFFKHSLKNSLKITHNFPSEFTNPTWGGEYRYFHIFLNKNYQLSKDDFKGLIVHESGHFIGLSHNNVPHSVMNHYSPYNTSLSEQDIKNAKNIKWLLLLKLLFHRLTVAPCP